MQTVRNLGDISFDNSFCQGKIVAQFSVLSDLFGRPFEPVDAKVDTEWALEFEDNDGTRIPATIYSWKGSAQDGGSIWHVGGYDRRAYEMVARFVGGI